MFNTKVNAASFGMSANKSGVNVGENVTISITGNGLTGRVNLSSTGGSLSSNSIWIEGDSKSVTLSTSAAGNITVSASGVLSDDDGNEKNYSKACTISVTEKQTTNTVTNESTTKNNTSSTTKNTTTNNKVKTSVVEETEEKTQLGIYYLIVYAIDDNGQKSEISLDKTFDLNTFEYNCDVTSNIKKIEIAADAKDYNNLLVIEGADKELSEGENIITLTVSQQDQNIKYTIKINKEYANIEPENTTTKKKSILDNKIAMPVVYFALIQAVIILLEIAVVYIVIKRKTKKLI